MNNIKPNKYNLFLKYTRQNKLKYHMKEGKFCFKYRVRQKLLIPYPSFERKILQIHYLMLKLTH